MRQSTTVEEAEAVTEAVSGLVVAVAEKQVVPEEASAVPNHLPFAVKVGVEVGEDTTR